MGTYLTQEERLQNYKLESMRAARQLMYPESILDEIIAADTEGAVIRALMKGRLNLDERYRK